MRRMAVVLGLVVGLVGAFALAGSAGGPTQAGLEAAGWACSPVGDLPPGHCISPGTGMNAAQGNFRTSWNIMVFNEDGSFRGAETATTNPRANGRPCPHGDIGVWWSPGDGPTGVPLYVCHHH